MVDEDGRRLVLLVEPVEAGVAEGLGELAGAVRPEVPVDDRVSITYAAGCGVADNEGLDELVAHAAVVARADRIRGILGLLTDAVDDRVIGPFGAVPPLVAVHGPVPSADGGDRRRALRYRAPRRTRGPSPAGFAPVREGVHEDPLHAESARQVEQRRQVTLARVHPPVADQPDHVQRGAPAGVHRLDHGRDPVEGSVGDRLVDSNEHLRYPPPGAEVEVSNLRVALLPLGEPDREADASRCDADPSRARASRLGVRARLTALPGPGGAIPNPSITTSTSGPITVSGTRRDPTIEETACNMVACQRQVADTRLTPPRRSARTNRGRGWRRRPARHPRHPGREAPRRCPA